MCVCVCRGELGRRHLGRGSFYRDDAHVGGRFCANPLGLEVTLAVHLPSLGQEERSISFSGLFRGSFLETFEETKNWGGRTKPAKQNTTHLSLLSTSTAASVLSVVACVCVCVCVCVWKSEGLYLTVPDDFQLCFSSSRIFFLVYEKAV